MKEHCNGDRDSDSDGDGVDDDGENFLMGGREREREKVCHMRNNSTGSKPLSSYTPVIFRNPWECSTRARASATTNCALRTHTTIAGSCLLSKAFLALLHRRSLDSHTHTYVCTVYV